MENPLKAFLPEEQANLIFLLLLAIPLSGLLYRVHDKYLFLALTTFLTMTYQSILFPFEKYFLWTQQIVVFLLLRFSPRKSVGHIVAIQSSIALAAVQLRRMYISYGQNGVDITGIFMMQFFNYVGLAYNHANSAKDPAKLSASQMKRLVSQPPEILTYIGYVMFLPACLVGPVYQYADFEAYFNRRGDYAVIPSPLLATFKQFGIFALSGACYFASSYFSIDLVLTEEFASHYLPVKILIIMVIITHVELKYVTAWSLGMVGMRASGFTYNKQKERTLDNGTTEHDFGRVEQTNIYGFYFNPEMKIKAQSWNIGAQVALRRYIYDQVNDSVEAKNEKERKQIQAKAQYATFLGSALWHGFYFGYLVTFIHWVFCLQIFQSVYRNRKLEGTFLNKIENKFPLMMRWALNVASTFVLTYYGMAMHLMIWPRIKVYLAETYCIPYICLYAIYFFTAKMNKPSRTKGEVKPTGTKQN